STSLILKTVVLHLIISLTGEIGIISINPEGIVKELRTETKRILEQLVGKHRTTGVLQLTEGCHAGDRVVAVGGANGIPRIGIQGKIAIHGIPSVRYFLIRAIINALRNLQVIVNIQPVGRLIIELQTETCTFILVGRHAEQ